MSDKRNLRVFLSYAHDDIVPVRKLYQDLIDEGYDIWFDEENLIPGQEWQVEIEKALLNSHAVIVCLSPISVSKEGFVQKEFRFAFDKALEMTESGIFLIPVRLKECEVPHKISRYHWVDLFEDNGYKKLLLALRSRSKSVHGVPYEDSVVPKGETISSSRFKNLEQRKEFVEKLEEMIAQGEKFIFLQTINSTVPVVEALLEARNSYEEASKSTLEHELSKVEKTFREAPTYSISRLQYALQKPFLESHKLIIQRKIDEIKKII